MCASVVYVTEIKYFVFIIVSATVIDLETVKTTQFI